MAESKIRKITAIVVAKPGRVVELEQLLGELAAPSRAEPGNLRWDVWRDEENPARFVLDELYQDSASVMAHRASPHFKNYAAAIGDLADRTAVVSEPFDMA